MTHQNVSKKAKSNDGMYALLLDEYYGSHPMRFGAYVVPGGQPDISDATSQLEGELKLVAVDKMPAKAAAAAAPLQLAFLLLLPFPRRHKEG